MKPREIRGRIAESIWENLSAHDVEAFCVRLGMRPAAEGENPFNSKRRYVLDRVNEMGVSELKDVVRKILEEWDDPTLAEVLVEGNARGVDGTMKNLIFAAKGAKPQIVLRDALNNVVEIVKHEKNCLFYDRPLAANGLRWSNLVDWWKASIDKDLNDYDAAHDLWTRLHASLQSDPERLLFRTYTARYAEGFDAPALIPQVYLHYDPYSGGGTLTRQRMDFLMLLPNHQRVVIEIDGRHHYSDDDGKAAPEKYGQMVSEDRALTLAGYEVYRFGGREFVSSDRAVDLLQGFFESLLTATPRFSSLG